MKKKKQFPPSNDNGKLSHIKKNVCDLQQEQTNWQQEQRKSINLFV